MHNFIFDIYPNIALALRRVEAIARYEPDAFILKTSFVQQQLMTGSILFRVGGLTILVDYFLGLLGPAPSDRGEGHWREVEQVVALFAGRSVGIVTLLDGIVLGHRRRADPRLGLVSDSDDGAAEALGLEGCYRLNGGLAGAGTLACSARQALEKRCTRSWARS